MTRAQKLATVLRLSRIRLGRRQRALGEAAEACLVAERALAAAEDALARAHERRRAAEGEFRQRPQCPHRQMLREVTGERVLSAEDSVRVAELELADAEELRVVARQALLREEARVDQLEGLLQAARRQQAERVLGREEDEWIPRARAA